MGGMVSALGCLQVSEWLASGGSPGGTPDGLRLRRWGRVFGSGMLNRDVDCWRMGEGGCDESLTLDECTRGGE